jgi:hypothetical protein
MKLSLFLIFLTILLVSCDHQTNESSSAVSDFEFYLPDSIDSDPEHSPMTQLRTSALFQAIGEPNLKDYQGEKEIYRLTYKMSFSIFDDVVYRLEINEDKVIIHVNAGSGEIPQEVLNHYNIPDGIFYSTDRHTTSHFSTVRYNPLEVVDSLRSMVSSFDFWNQPSTIDFLGNDGDSYILEVYRGGKYHAIYRWNPAKGREEYIIRDIHELMYDQIASSVLNPDSLRVRSFEE